MTRIIAYYLPQYHEIPENNEWWGKGFTEWVNVKKAEPLFDGHNQPRIPLNNNYYDLSDVSNMRWQASLAKEYGLYGFCFYHYWFSEKPLLEKPLINYLNDKSIDFPFCFCWANESWTNGWAKSESSIILEQKYGDREEWKKHFYFLLPFFNDDRYIKEDNCPLLVIYRPYLYENMIEMLNYWKDLAINNGFNGIKVASQRYENPCQNKELFDYLDYNIEYQPGVARKNLNGNTPLYKTIRSRIHNLILDVFNKDISIHQNVLGPVKVNYDEVWNNIINSKPTSSKAIAGAFVDWDNTPRHKRRGTVYTGVTPAKFEKYMKLQIRNMKSNYNNDYLFMFAWNEWGEGGYLEPDTNNEYSYLKAIKKAIEES